jgi:hypothetical protein
VPLPIRQGLGGEGDAKAGDDASDSGEEAASEATEPEALHPRRRSVSSRAVRELVQRAARLRRSFEEWPRRAPFEAHLRALRTFLGTGLGWRQDDGTETDPGAGRLMEEALKEARAAIPPALEIDREELRRILAGLLREAGRAPLGGKGGGVQVLSVTEARGRTFQHLFVLGLQRNSFPRVVRQDSLLPDDLRAVLVRLLPDLPLKLAGYDEERYLFAQLLSAAPEVTLSWQSADDDGKLLPASPLVDRLRGALTIERAPAATSGGPSALQTAGERALAAGLRPLRGREAFSRLLPRALAEARGLPLRQAPPHDLAALAAGRIAVLGELDPDLRSEEGRAVRARLGPYYGFVGALAAASDPRHRTLYVTHLEHLAGCPWQLFLERLLGIEAAPDPAGLLPGIDPSLLGRTVHAVLEAIGRPAFPKARAAGEAAAPAQVELPFPEPEAEGEAALSAPAPVLAPVDVPVLVAWPSPEDLAALTREAATKLLASGGVYLAGLAGALAQQALPYLEVARRLDWPEGSLPLLGIEVEGEIAAHAQGGRTVPVRFRADRIDLAASPGEAGPVLRRWTDYKTGRPLSEGKKEETRRRHVLAAIRAGTHLQAVAYVLAARAGSGGPGGAMDAVGRYLYLDPAIESDELRDVAIRSSDTAFLDELERAMAALLESWEVGSLFPRLVELDGRKEPPRCARCDVAEACLRGDSGARRRLFDWTVGADASAIGAAESALLRTWRLAVAPEEGA